MDTTALFITGTDTGIGKTWVSAAMANTFLTAGHSVSYYKPIQTGTPLNAPPEDPAFIDRIFDNHVKTACRYCFVSPVTPSVADTAGIISFSDIADDVTQYRQQTDRVLVEGAGGLMAPISTRTLMIDLIQYLKLPVILVSHCKLGAINQTLLSIEALQHRDINIAGLVFNFYPLDTHEADPAVQSLLDAIQPHLPPKLPIWLCYDTPYQHPHRDHLTNTIDLSALA